MDVESPPPSRYALSFTSGDLFSREAQIAAPLYLEMGDWKAVRQRIYEENLLQARTATSAFRLARELANRLAVLKNSELNLLNDSGPSERSHLMWVAACRSYAFIGEFAEEVVRERFLLLAPTLGHHDFDSFAREKLLWHPELAEVSDATLKKLRRTLFQMLTQAGLLADGEIVHASLSERIRNQLNAQEPSDVRFFPTHDSGECVW